MSSDPAVIIIGAGVAGLAAAYKLVRAGLAVHMVEARDRIGGRIHTHIDSACDYPIELGAEFIHGKSPEIWNLLGNANTGITEVQGDAWCIENGRLSLCGFWDEVDGILEQMDDSKSDESFAEFLDRCCLALKTEAQQRVKQRALGYVSGFNAADPALVGVHWLVKEMRAEEKTAGDRSFRSRYGYQDLLDVFRRELQTYNIVVQHETVVRQLEWKAGKVKITIRGKHAESALEAPRVLITLPLPLLKASSAQQGAVQFTPELPRHKIDALNRMEMGKASRLTLRFRERFWDSIKPEGAKKSLTGMSFLFGQDDWFPTWWTASPAKWPIITGWATFRSSERLSGKGQSFVVEKGLQTLGSLLRIRQSELEGLLEEAHSHDWQTDPFSCGAYSYGKVGAVGACQALAEPIENTLYFAGEATDTTGNNGTVHGAIASGYRAAQQILNGVG